MLLRVWCSGGTAGCCCFNNISVADHHRRPPPPPPPRLLLLPPSPSPQFATKSNPPYPPPPPPPIIAANVNVNSFTFFTRLPQQQHSASASASASASSTSLNDKKKKKKKNGLAAATSSILLLLLLGGISFPSTCRAALPPPPVLLTSAQPEEEEEEVHHQVVDKEEVSPSQPFISKTFAFPVPLKILALRGSIPPSWLKDFIQSQGKRLRLRIKYLSSLDDIFSHASSSFHNRHNVPPPADVFGVGDSWLSLAIRNSIIQPIPSPESQDWFSALTHKWKVYLRRNHAGEIDPHGQIWAAPYRWGTMVIAYKKTPFQKHNLPPIQDWVDLWRPELAGRISMIDSPREVVGMVLKSMGASYNTKNIELEVAGGRAAVKENLRLLGKQVLILSGGHVQVRLFDSMHYLKAFGVGDAWVAVGWSSDVLPVAKRMSNVGVIVPKSGASLWADLWVIPAASKLKTNLIGGEVRGPSPVIHQWIEFCLQAARELPFKQEVIPGTVPLNLKSTVVEASEELYKGKPKLDSNLVCGIPPSEILSKCEFLEPLPDATISDYEWLIASMLNQGPALNQTKQHHLLSSIQTFCLRVLSRCS
ncbi:hypothetical protein Tsubulata_036652 [Turnera subulata]|uniref:Uncharacterized protein n=1 Tax=Turnera subulata TaxID=218843 RepID=A0A9Q0FQ94_9ROSI|nr:hypothetical protein Tsubulata_036652 [Turnera subulata]